MERKIIFLPAYDKTDPDPEKNYGVGDLDIIFVVTGDKGTTNFEISTNWYLDTVMKRRVKALKEDVYLRKKDFLLEMWIKPFPMDVFYHSLTRIFEDDHYFQEGISYFENGKPCYYGYRYEVENKDDPREKQVWTTNFVYWKLITEGDEPVWKFLEEYYKEIFE